MTIAHLGYIKGPKDIKDIRSAMADTHRGFSVTLVLREDQKRELVGGIPNVTDDGCLEYTIVLHPNEYKPHGTERCGTVGCVLDGILEGFNYKSDSYFPDGSGYINIWSDNPDDIDPDHEEPNT